MSRRGRHRHQCLGRYQRWAGFLSRQASVRGAMLHLVLLYSLLAALWALSISLAIRVAGLGAERFGSLLAMVGLGLAIGAVLIAQLGHRFRRSVLAAIGLGGMGFCLVLLAQLRPNLWTTLALCGVLGLGTALVGIPAQTTIQEDTPEADGQGVWPAEQPGEHRPQPAARAGRHLGGKRWPATGAAAVGPAGVCRRRHGAAMATQLNAAASFSSGPSFVDADRLAREKIALLRQRFLRLGHHRRAARSGP